MKSRVVAVGFGVLSILAIAACGSDSGTGATPATTIKIGTPSYQTLAPVVTSTTTAATVLGQAPGTPVAGEQSYTIASGDYLYGIAKRFCVKAEEVGVYNGWTDGVQHPLNPGEAIKIPPNGCLPGTATETTTAAAAPEATTPVATSTTFDAASGATYVVVAGDYLTGIAKKTGTTVDAIVAANGWSDGADHVIIPGQTIKLPAKAG